MYQKIIKTLSPELPVLIAGPTASGKSELALQIAQAQGGRIVNADASQVYRCWQVISARPNADDEARATHCLYGHISWNAPYSTGHWLREVSETLKDGPRPIIVGGTGLYFAALTEGLAEIPPTPADIRDAGNQLTLSSLLQELDNTTCSIIDTANRARVQRAWEVQKATGRPLYIWQQEQSTPLIPLETAQAIVMHAPKDWLTPRIETRFDKMLELGALDEVQAMKDVYDPTLPAFRAIGVPELMQYLQGDMDLKTARERATIATRQYAKRQRTWFRKRCTAWRWYDLTEIR